MRDEVAYHIRVYRDLGAVLALGVVGEGDAGEGEEVAVVARGPDVGRKLGDELGCLTVVLIHLRALVVGELRKGLSVSESSASPSPTGSSPCSVISSFCASMVRSPCTIAQRAMDRTATTARAASATATRPRCSFKISFRSSIFPPLPDPVRLKGFPVEILAPSRHVIVDGRAARVPGAVRIALVDLVVQVRAGRVAGGAT